MCEPSFRWYHIWCIWEQCSANGPIQHVVCRSKGLHPRMLYHERLCFPQPGESSGVEEQDGAELHGTPKAVFTPFDRGGLQRECPASSHGRGYLAWLPQERPPCSAPNWSWLVPSRGQHDALPYDCTWRHSSRSRWSAKTDQVQLLWWEPMFKQEVQLQSQWTKVHPILPLQRRGRLQEQIIAATWTDLNRCY